ncbi:MAG: group 1 glycosyl transferase [Rhodospirillaceae bacterium]|nr:MAG: group 1 glycosyl transferase [Rhodospirillaceae bacterium]
MLGTIETRKNHKLILELWRELQADLGASAPRLLVIGEYGWKGEDVIALLERSTPHGIVKVYGRLSDAAIAGLLKGARSLLLPSFAEDYGLPLAEALTLGTPVLCSDIPAFREVGGDIPDYLDPADPLAWRGDVLDDAEARSAQREAQLRRLSFWSRPTCDRHFAVVANALRDLRKEKGGP